MTTAAQIHANRQNARRSTGPRTEEGKARCRGNATRHGFFSRDLAAILAEEDPEERESRRVRLNLMWHPETGVEVDLVDRLAVIGDEMARATRFEREYLIGEARRAVLEAAARRSEEAREDGRRLLGAGEDVEPGTDGAVERRSISPGVLLGRLEATAEGCLWLMTRWEDLARLIDDGAGWDANDREAFCRLLGATTADRDPDPRIRRAMGACDILWPRPMDEMLSPSESCASPDREGARACLLAVVEGESARLEALLADCEAEQEGEAAAAVAGTVCDMGTGFERFQRHRAGLRREERKTIDQLLKLRKAEDRRTIQALAPIRVREERDEAPPSAVKAPGRPEPEGPYRWWNDPANFPETTAQSRAPELDSRPTSGQAGMSASYAVGDLGRFLRDEGVATGSASVLTGRPEAGHGPVDPEEDPVARRGRRPDPAKRARAFRQDRAKLARTA